MLEIDEPNQKTGKKKQPKRIELPNGREQCTSAHKVIWNNRHEAKYQAERYRKKHGAKMSAYFCTCCGGWHIGHRRYHQQLVKRLKEQTSTSDGSTVAPIVKLSEDTPSGYT